MEHSNQFERDTGPAEEQASYEAPERAFFDPDNLPAVEDIPLEHLRQSASGTTGQRISHGCTEYKIVRYLVEASQGAIDDETYAISYKFAENFRDSDNINLDHIMEVSDTLEEQQPRVIDLMTRVRQEKIFSETDFVSVNISVLLVSGALLIREIQE